MKPGDLRRFKDDLNTTGAGGPEGRTFLVLQVRQMTVDILLDGGVEAGLGYFWVEDSSEHVDEAG
jgi:hypothetical protein